MENKTNIDYINNLEYRREDLVRVLCNTNMDIISSGKDLESATILRKDGWYNVLTDFDQFKVNDYQISIPSEDSWYKAMLNVRYGIEMNRLLSTQDVNLALQYIQDFKDYWSNQVSLAQDEHKFVKMKLFQQIVECFNQAINDHSLSIDLYDNIEI